MISLLNYALQTSQITIQDYPIVSPTMEALVCAGISLLIGCGIFLFINKRKSKNKLKKHNPNRDNVNG